MSSPLPPPLSPTPPPAAEPLSAEFWRDEAAGLEKRLHDVGDALDAAGIDPDDELDEGDAIRALAAERDHLSCAIGQALVAATLAAGEYLAHPPKHHIVSVVARLRAEALGQRADNAMLMVERDHLRKLVGAISESLDGGAAPLEEIPRLVHQVGQMYATLVDERDHLRELVCSIREELGLLDVHDDAEVLRELAALKARRGESESEDEEPEDWRFCEGCGCPKETARARSWSDHAWCNDCTSRE